MSFSMTAVFTVLLTLGQIYNGGEFIREFKPNQDEQVVQIMRRACHSMITSPEVQKVNFPALVDVMRNGLARYQQMRQDAIESYCAAQSGSDRGVLLNPGEESEPSVANKSLNSGSTTDEADTEILLNPEDSENSEDALGTPLIEDSDDQSKGADTDSKTEATAKAVNKTGGSCDRVAAARRFELENAELIESYSQELQIFKGFTIEDAIEVFDYLCKEPFSENRPSSVVVNEIIANYNLLAGEALDVDLVQYRKPNLPQSNVILAADEKTLVGETYESGGRRSWVSLDKIPKIVQEAFISAEDNKFRDHIGVDPAGILRGFLKYMQSKRIEGGSTITQQVVKNMILDSEISLERKIKEIILAVRLEKILGSKDKILEIYLNLIYLGRSSWGLEMATQNYFGENMSVSDLGLNEATFFAGLTHSPNSYEPDRGRRKIQERQEYVARRLKEDGVISEQDLDYIHAQSLPFIKRPPIKKSYFLQAVEADIKKFVYPEMQNRGGLEYISTQNPKIQKVMEHAIQEHLARYEMRENLVQWTGPVRRLVGEDQGFKSVTQLSTQVWSSELQTLSQVYSDIQWDLAVVLSTHEGIRIGWNSPEGPAEGKLYIGSQGETWPSRVRGELQPGDVVFGQPLEQGLALRVPPTIQAASVAMEVNTGRVVALSGGYGIGFSEHNRALYSFRQPGSTVKPFTYMAALQQGFQPNTLIPNEAVYIPKVGNRCDAYSPANFSQRERGVYTLRQGLERSSNRTTLRLLKAMAPNDPVAALNRVRAVAKDFGVYDDPYYCFPFILGADEVRVLDLVRGYAAIANGGQVFEPYFLDIENHSSLIQRLPSRRRVTEVDGTTLDQIKNLLTGVVARGTARSSLSDLNPPDQFWVAGKTGTSNDYKNVWFAGFTDKIAVGVWVGYDRPRSLGSRGLGGTLAAPIAKDILKATFEQYPPEDLLQEIDRNIVVSFEAGYPEFYRRGVGDTSRWILDLRDQYQFGHLRSDPADTYMGSGEVEVSRLPPLQGGRQELDRSKPEKILTESAQEGARTQFQRTPREPIDAADAFIQAIPSSHMTWGEEAQSQPEARSQELDRNINGRMPSLGQERAVEGSSGASTGWGIQVERLAPIEGN